jgi:hypothetical protein
MESKKRKFEQTLRKYKGKWVLIEFKELDESLNVVEGKVVAHSSNKEEIYKKQLELKEKNLTGWL